MRKRKYSSLPLVHTFATSGVDNTHGQQRQWGDYDTIPLPTVHNIVATSQIVAEGGSLEPLDLNKIHEMLPFSFYDQHKFAAITVRLHQPDCTTLLFSSGKLVVTGCRTWYECVYASLFIAGLLDECLPGCSFKLHACDVQNMVAHVEIPVDGGHLDLHGMYASMALNCTYQRKMFPGLIYRPESSPVVLLCFFSGKIVITGGKTMEDVFSGWRRLWPTLKAFVVPRILPALVLGEAGGSTITEQLGEGREEHEGLPFEGDAVTGDARGVLDALKEPAGGGGGRGEILDLIDAGELEGLCNDLATESHALVLGRGLTRGAAEEGGEP